MANFLKMSFNRFLIEF